MDAVFDQLGHKFGKRSLFEHKSGVLSSGITVVTGPNGAGKSTFLSIAAGLLSPSSGSVFWTVNGKRIDRFQLRTSLGFCAPALSLYEELSVRENLAFLDRMRNIPNGFASERANSWGLDPLLDLSYRKLSSGQQQRVKLAAAFHPEASFLVLDEPTTNLDAAMTGLVHEKILEASQSATVLLASNDPRDLALYPNHIQIP